MQKIIISGLIVATVLVAGIFFNNIILAGADDDDNGFQANLEGFQEAPAVSSTGTGTFSAELSSDETSITYTLSYSNLEAPVTSARIHFGQPDVNGGIIAFLCSNLGAPAGTQPCPPSPATVTGTITAADVIGPTAQGIAPTEFNEVVNALNAGMTYVNVGTTKHPLGEIRGQIQAEDD